MQEAYQYNAAAPAKKTAPKKKRRAQRKPQRRREETLVRPQRLDGRHPHAAARRHVRRDRRHDEQDQRAGGERPRIERFDLEQQPLEQTRQRAGRHEAGDDADERRAAAPGRSRAGIPTPMTPPAPCARRSPACAPSPNTPSRRTHRPPPVPAPPGRTLRPASRSRAAARSCRRRRPRACGC